MEHRTVVALLTVVTTFAILAGFGPTYRHADFTVELPDGWHVGSPEALQRTKDLTSLTYAAVFLSEPWDGVGPFELPYILVKVNPYPPGRRLTKNDAQDAVRGITGSAPKALDKLGMELGDQNNAVLDWPNRRFTWRVDMNTPLGVLGLEQTGYFAAHEVILVNYYDLPASWDDSLGLREQLRDSVTVTSGPPTGNGSNWSRVGTKGQGGEGIFDGALERAVGGGFIMFFLAAVSMITVKSRAAKKEAKDAKKRGESAEAIRDIYKKSGVTAFSRKTGILIILGIVLLIVSACSVWAVLKHNNADYRGMVRADRCGGCWLDFGGSP